MTQPISCQQCGTGLERREGNYRYCSDACRKARTNAKLRAAAPWGTPERKAYIRTYYQNNKERLKEIARLYRQANKEKVHAGVRDRRNRKLGVQAGDPYKRLEIFEADDWTCHICGKQIDRAAPWPLPWSPVVDHVIPLDPKHGGLDCKTNCRASHARCNAAKSNLLMSEITFDIPGPTEEEIALFGRETVSAT